MSVPAIQTTVSDTAVGGIPVPTRIREIARRRPDAIAVEDGAATYDYGALVVRADTLAARLRTLGVGPGDRVGLCAPASFGLVVGALAVLSVGAAYVPIDPAYPAERRAFLVADAPARLLLTTEDLSLETSGIPLTPADVDPDDVAYVIYTSGSTGVPKGVEIPHRGLSNLVAWHLRSFGIRCGDRTSLVAGVGFDASVWELWPSLAAGATVVIAPPEVRFSPRAMRDWLVERQITSCFLPTVIAERIVDLPWPPGTKLRTLLTGGDALRRRPPSGLPFALINNYGPTECSVVATSGVVEPGHDVPGIGRLISGLTAAVLDPKGTPVPDGMTGELYLAGAGLARGYAGLPDLTHARFVRLPDGRRAYRTGDLVARHPDGTFDFHGRADDQVQIRGHRVEPGEVAAVLAAHPQVGSAVVIARPGPAGEAQLVGYLVPSDGTPTEGDLRHHLSARLPGWMVPTAFVVLDSLPQTANGKIDLVALPAPVRRGADRVTARTRTEADLVAIWTEVLGHDDLGVNDPFETVGGHSLAAAQADARIASRLGVAAAGTRLTTTIAEQACALAEHAAPAVPLRRAHPAAAPAPATAAQRRLWLLDQMTPHPTLYSNATVFRLSGSVDERALAEALTVLLERHEVLRTAFVDGPDGLRQVVCSQVTVPLPVANRETSAEQQEKLARAPFDLTRPPLLRALLSRLDADTAELLLCVHHIAFDGASLEVLLDDLAELYAAAVEQRPFRLDPLNVQASDVGWWEPAALAGVAGDRMRDYWAEQLATPVIPPALPTDRPRPPRPTFRGSTVCLPLPPGLYDRIRAGSGGTTATVLCALAALLHTHTRQREVVIGIPVAGRARAELEPLIGCFVNTLPLRCHVDRTASFADLQRSTSATLAGALAHSELPYDQIIGLTERTGTAAVDLVTVLLVVQPTPRPARPLPGGRLEFVAERHADVARFDLTFVLEHRDGAPTLTVEYSTDLFERSSANALAEQLLRLLAAGLSAPQTPVGALPLTAPGGSATLEGPVRCLGDRPVHEHIRDSAAARPSAEAIVCGDVAVTYSELLERAETLARRLAGAGVRPEEPVAICLSRSAASVVAMLGAFTSGGVYVALDPAYPDDRLRQVMDDLGSCTLITSAALWPRLTALVEGRSLPTVLLTPDGRVDAGTEMHAETTPDVVGLRHAAYMVSTSGSTGRPKGVLLEHGGLLNLAYAKMDRFAVDASSRVLQYVSFGFGVSVADVCMTLLAGGTLLVRGPEPLAGPQLVDALRHGRISHLVVPPSVLATLPDADLPELKTVVVGGEACTADMVARWATGRRFVQAYGPTEATVCSTSALCEPDGRRPLIGRPLPGVRVTVVDEDLRPVPPGVLGELLIGGAGVGRGYHGRPELTAERFIPDPRGRPGERAYRTGDLGRLRPDGQLELLGRDDDQLKLRGLRVEAGDVEAALRAHPQVAEAAVAIRRHPSSGDLLVGYVVAVPETTLDPAAVRSSVRDLLPPGLVPAAVVPVSALPRTGSGKLDRNALPPMPQTELSREARPPRTSTEELIAPIWAELLLPGDDRAVSVNDDFFALGGQSLVAAQLVARVRELFDVPLTVRTLYDASTIAALAVEVDTLRGHTPKSPPSQARTTDLPAPQRRIWLHEQLRPGTAAYHIPVVWQLRGTLDVVALDQAVHDVVTRHTVLRTMVVVSDDGEPRAEIAPPAAFAVEHLSVSDELAVDARIAELTRRPFVLDHDLPLRVELIDIVGTNRYTLVVVVHHIAFDGWSAGILARELSAAYAARRAGEQPAPPLAGSPPAPVETSGRLAYWHERLAGAPELLALPLDRVRPDEPSGRGAILHATLDPGLADGIRALATAERTTGFTVLLAAFAAAAGRWTGADEVVIGVPVAGRDQPETFDAIGCFVNTVPVRVSLEQGLTGRALVRQVRAGLLADLEHAVGFERLVETIVTEHSRAVTPLIQALFVAADAPREQLTLPEIETSAVAVDPGAAKLDLSMSVDTAGAQSLQLTYNTDVFTAATARRLADQYAVLVAALVANPEAPAATLALGGQASTANEQVLLPRAPSGSVLELFRSQVAQVPEHVAVVDEDGELTYADLDRQSRVLAGVLHRHGAGPETTVGLLAERSVGALVALVGILQAGAAYVPIEPTQPAARIATLLAAAGTRLVVVPRDLAHLVPDSCVTVVMEELSGEPAEPAPIDPSSLAYAITTSGSTGEPKAVAVEHRQLRAYVDAVTVRLGLDTAGSFALASTLAADLGHTSLFPALCSGATVHLVSREVATDPVLFADLQRRRPADVLKIVPAQLAALMTGPDPTAVLPRRLLVLGGDAAGWGLVDRVHALAPDLRIVNHYGPTEATVGALTHEVAASDDRPPTIPLGLALPHAVARVLDANRSPVPPGVAGELYLGGAGVARGYLGRPELTAEWFTADPYGGPDDRLYRTGDRVRRLIDGTVEFLGRMDEQVKIRGHRVEPGEVAAALRCHPGVRDAVVVVGRERGEPRLLAYAVGNADPTDLREFLADRLPAALVPAGLMIMDAFPLTPNGKIDRRALPIPDPPPAPGSRPPATESERLLAGIWCEVLRLERVNADDDFFALGGHSLLATQVVARLRHSLGAEVPVSTIFAHPTLARLAAALPGPNAAPTAATLPPLLPTAGPVPLSFGQRRLWFLDQAAPDEATYHLPYALRLRGRLDADLLERSLARIVQRHDALRTTFPSEGGAPRVVVHDRRPAPLERIDLSAYPDPEDALRTEVKAALHRPFDLASGPLFRFGLLRLGPQEHVLLFTFHHIAFDGWSFTVLLDELAVMYAAAGAPAQLPDLGVGYADYARWQQDWTGRPVLDAQRDFWRGQLADMPAALELPTDRPRPPRQTHLGDVVWLDVPGTTQRRVEAFATRHGATPFMVLLAAYQALLARHTGQLDVTVGTPVAGRRDAATEAMIGFFVNMLAVRTDLSGEPSFAELVRRVRGTTLAAYEHQDLPFDQLVNDLRPDRDLSRSPIFQTLLTLQNAPAPRAALPGLTWTIEHMALGVAKYDLSLVLTERDGGLAGALEYNTDLFDASTAERLAQRFSLLLDAALADPDRPFTSLAITGPEERIDLDRWNASDAAIPEPAVVTALVAAQVAARPDATAISGEDTTLTYAELDTRANQLAHQLIALGVGAEDAVGLQLERSANMVVGLLGILKAGAAYVPLDPAYPRQRLDYMLADSGAVALVTMDDLTSTTAFHGPTIRLDADADAIAGRPVCPPKVALDPDQLAYVLYTSGSTGRPKGVEVSHRNVVNAVLSPGQPTLGSADVVLAVVSLCFDGSVTELLRPLSAGARLVVAPRAVVTDGVRLAAALHSSGATVMMVPTPFGRILVDSGWPGDGQLKLSVGGEALTPELAAALLPRTSELWNEYGPTETTVLSTSALVRDPDRMTIGTPVANTRILILDTAQRPVPIGVPGEICVGGLGVARGYHDRPALTAERFVPDPSPDHPGERLYRSGDLGRWRADGALEHLGRLDHQVKLRGFRIETGEIEAACETHPLIRQAAVVLHRDTSGDSQLVAYVVPSDPESAVTATELSDHLARHLPNYMLPARTVFLPTLPTTPVGKVDRAALPAPMSITATSQYRPPRTPTEIRIAAVWADVLGLEPTTVGVDDDFFALGGESMKAVRAVRRIDERLPVLDLFAQPTLGRLAAYVDALDGSAPRTHGVLHRLSETVYGDAEVTVVCVPFGGGGAISYRDLAAHLPKTWAVAGLEPPGHDFARGNEPLADWDQLADAAAAEILTGIPGKIVLYGHCVGSALAVALARRLEDAGRPVLGVAVGANFPAARMPGLLGRLARLWPGSRQSDRALQDSLITLGGLAEHLPDDEQRLLARNVRHDARQADIFYSSAFADPERHRLTAPLLCVVGGEDRMSDFAHEQVADWSLFSERVELAVIDRAEHFFNRQQAAELASTLTRQVDRWREPTEAHVCHPRTRARLTDFAIVVLGQLISMIGTGITTFALGVWAFQMTGRLETFAAVQLFGLLPAIAAGPFAGAVADRIDRRRVMIACDLVGLATAATMALLLLTGELQIWQLYVVVSVAGMAAAFRQPAYLAGATQLVPKRYLGNANGLLQFGTASGLVVAQLLGGALMAVTGLPGAIFLDLVSYATALGTLVIIRFPDAVFRKRPETFRAEIVGGWRYLLARPPLLALTGFFTGANAFGGIVFVLVSPLALTTMSTASLGTVLAAQGVGMLAGGALMAVWGGTRRRVAGMVGSVGLFAVSALLIGLRPGPLPAAVGMFGIGVCAALISAHWLALVQATVPSGMQGRVIATCLMLARLATPIGIVLVGPVVSSLLLPLVDGPLSGLTAGLAPTPAGRAMAVAMALTGLLALLWTGAGLASRILRHADDLLAEAAAEAPEYWSQGET